jgi:hypothetical protein
LRGGESADEGEDAHQVAVVADGFRSFGVVVEAGAQEGR